MKPQLCFFLKTFSSLICNINGEVEDEIHFLLKCPQYMNIRDNLFTYATSIIPEFDDLSEIQKLRTSTSHPKGGPFDTWGAMVFPSGSNFFFDSQLKRTIFFRPYQKQTIFFSAVKLKTIFFTIYFIWFSVHHVKLSRCHHIYLNFSPCFFIRKAIVWNMLNRLLKLWKNFNFWS